MVVLKQKIKLLIFLLGVCFAVGCTKDRLIDVQPVVYPVEYWKKDSLVYTLYDDNAIYTQQTTSYGISSPDTLTLKYENNRFRLTFFISNKTGGEIDSISGDFSIVNDSLFLFSEDTIKREIFSKDDSLLILEYTIISGSYFREYKEFYQLLDINAEEALVSFRNDIYEPIFNNNGEGKCMPCHNSNGGQMVLQPAALAYEAFINGVSENDGAVPYINTLQPEQSYLYRLIANDNVKYAMPPNSSLTSYEIETVLKWISQGAQNN